MNPWNPKSPWHVKSITPQNCIHLPSIDNCSSRVVQIFFDRESFDFLLCEWLISLLPTQSNFPDSQVTFAKTFNCQNRQSVPPSCSAAPIQSQTRAQEKKKKKMIWRQKKQKKAQADVKWLAFAVTDTPTLKETFPSH